jgi:hypothetical protein
MSESRVYLRGVDLSSIVEKYLASEFITLIDPLPVIISNHRPQTNVAIKRNVNDMTYQFDLGTGQNFACLGYKVVDKDGSYATYDPNGKHNCMYCIREIPDKPIGIPIIREERISPVGINKIYFHMVDIFCNFNCWKAEIRKRKNNVMYSSSTVYAAEIYNKCTGKDYADLLPASDQRYLKILNGPMSWDEFHLNSAVYSEKPTNMYFLPIIEFSEQSS